MIKDQSSKGFAFLALAVAFNRIFSRFPRHKEWAYAGMFFDLTGAAIASAVCGSQPLTRPEPGETNQRIGLTRDKTMVRCPKGLLTYKCCHPERPKRRESKDLRLGCFCARSRQTNAINV